MPAIRSLDDKGEKRIGYDNVSVKDIGGQFNGLVHVMARNQRCGSFINAMSLDFYPQLKSILNKLSFSLKHPPNSNVDSGRPSSSSQTTVLSKHGRWE